MIIKKFSEIKIDNIDWIKFGQRITKIREEKHFSIEKASSDLECLEYTLGEIEEGNPKKSLNFLWSVSRKWNLSLNWLLNGKGEPYDSDPPELLPPTLVIDRGSGIRKSKERGKAEEGEFGDEVFEFVMAVDKFKNINSVTFPSLTQIYELVQALGYRKSVPSRICPLGYFIEKSINI